MLHTVMPESSCSCHRHCHCHCQCPASSRHRSRDRAAVMAAAASVQHWAIVAARGGPHSLPSCSSSSLSLNSQVQFCGHGCLSTRNSRRWSYSWRPSLQARAQLVETPPSPSASEAAPYQNTFLDDIFYGMFRSQCQQELGWKSSNPEYEGLIEESKRLLRKHRIKTEVEEATVRILRSLFPPHLLPLFKRLIPPIADGKPAAILLARVTQATCQWLMGRCTMTEVQLADGSTLPSGVLVEKCKYLQESKCAGICIHTCKIPTQAFIMGDMGVPLTMEPNYEDFSCQFKFGVEPPPREQDKALSTPCLEACPIAAARQNIRSVSDSQQCPQVS